MEAGILLIAISSENQEQKMKSFLMETGCGFIHTARDSNECLRKTRQLNPDIVIIDFEFSKYMGYETARVIVEDGLSTTILLVNEGQISLMNNYKNNEDLICMVRPINKNLLTVTIELILKNRQKIKKLKNQIIHLKNSLDMRKTIEKAKGLLMQYEGLSENQAFRKMQKESMDTGIPMKEIADKILLSNKDKTLSKG